MSYTVLHYYKTKKDFWCCNENAVISKHGLKIPAIVLGTVHEIRSHIWREGVLVTVTHYDRTGGSKKKE